MDWRDYFKGKKITLMGLGVLGRGVGDALFLSECGAEVIVTDTKTEAELESSVKQLKEKKNITLHLGGHRVEDFIGRDLIIKGANVPLDSVFITEAKKNNIPVSMSTALFARFAGIPIIGVTGTRGKSTVTHIIHHVLTGVGKKPLLGGNVRGVSTLRLLSDISQYDCAVLELDSWQLQGFHEEKISPHIAVFTSFMPDHMNYYQNDMQTYLHDKSAIFAYQSSSDTLVISPQVATFLTGTYEDAKQRAVVAKKEDVLNIPVKLIGDHNKQNVACALSSLLAFGIEKENALKHIQTFAGVPGRLEVMGEVSGVLVINDNNSTTPDAVIAGLKAIQNSSVTLIIGGTDKGLSLDKLFDEIQNKVSKLTLLSGTGTERLKVGISIPYSEYKTLSECIAEAFRQTEKGGAILFSPGFASFSHEFKNEYERNDVFVSEVEAIKKAV
ncbi:MAG: UDP-N-acetylmuramoyl-L-alanine--D-glutamate ligase [Candidatus Paceibacterota bacterium]